MLHHYVHSMHTTLVLHLSTTTTDYPILYFCRLKFEAVHITNEKFYSFKTLNHGAHAILVQSLHDMPEFEFVHASC